MEENKKNSQLFGLLGKNISYSFSRGYFTEKFRKEGLKNHKYVNFDIAEITSFLEVVEKHKKDLVGMNVTIPYKLEIFNYLDKIDKEALKVGAVNTIKISKKGKLKGYNTDVYGFEKSLKPLLQKQHDSALILGTGGAAKAIAYVLNKLNVKYKFVSRNPKKKKEIHYIDITEKKLKKYTLIINCTPLGTYPKVEEKPNIPYEFLTRDHLLYDLIYNPKETAFLSSGKERGAVIKNGLEMLELQAEKAWEIWNK
ncbi:shikimate dehydrogenase [Tenacibaculum maritimum]|uniref:shikimate dehydrogenase family protein n=1 Tax=Tenacibaculum maritimum TaxID=107401 RepID=UPI0012E5C737|nr:shikimate dehydrogenase [Tenacibaculum maritimum]CAA0236706.1 Shikimate dehydrogenase [Tenacibaculum maritimum]